MRIFLLLILFIATIPMGISDNSTGLEDDYGLIYDMEVSSYSHTDIDLEVFDSLLGIQIVGFRGTTDEYIVANGSKQLSSLSFANNTREIQSIDRLNTHTITDTVGEKYKTSLFNSGWINATEYEDIYEYNETVNIWLGIADDEWQNTTDFVAATLHNYEVFNFTDINEANDLSLSGVNATADFRLLDWQISSEVIANSYSISGLVLADELLRITYHNSSNRIYRDTTDDLFNNVPYNVTQEVTMELIFDPLSKLYIESKYSSFYHFDVSANGDVSDGVSLVRADMDLDLNLYVNGSQQLNSIIDLSEDDLQAPLIEELWGGRVPDIPAWQLNDSGYFTVVVYTDGKLIKTENMYMNGIVSIDLSDIDWKSLSIIATDIYGNQSSMNYTAPEFNYWILGIVLIPSVYLIKKIKK